MGGTPLAKQGKHNMGGTRNNNMGGTPSKTGQEPDP